MIDKIYVPPLGVLASTADILMTPIMYLVSGTYKETPQRTHFWNNLKIKPEQVLSLQSGMNVFCYGIEASKPRFWFNMPLFHMPIMGGWRDYVVLCPVDDAEEWCVGWIGYDIAGVSRIKIRGPVRLLLGPGDVDFFGLNHRGHQIKVIEITRGRIGDCGPYAKTLLL